jgi:hypothetical protein
VETLRLVQVHRRIARVRRRRRVAGGIAAVLLLAIAGLALTTPHPGPVIQPAPPPNPDATVDGFAVYQYGARIVATKVAHLPVTELTVTYVPTTVDLIIATRCSPQDSVDLDITVNGDLFSSGSCDVVTSNDNPNGMSTFGVAVGKPSTFKLTAKAHGGAEVPGAGEFALGIGERMPFESYPFPPRPATLKPINFDHGNDWAYRIDSDPADPLAPRSIQVVWPAVVRDEGPEAVAVSLTPGYLRLSVDGRLIGIHAQWDYVDRTTSAFLGGNVHHQPGEVVTLTVEPSKVTGPWAVAVFVDGP